MANRYKIKVASNKATETITVNYAQLEALTEISDLVYLTNSLKKLGYTTEQSNAVTLMLELIETVALPVYDLARARD